MAVPAQKPGKSEQVVETPNEFVYAVRKLLNISVFHYDLAATKENSKAVWCITEEQDALHTVWCKLCNPNWMWLNPPFGDIDPWVTKCEEESALGARIAVLVPASVGSNWWNNHVRGTAQVYFLTPRITFVGHKHPYPKDLALLLYRPDVMGGTSTWNWKATASM